jgi:SagB-type dehydrogenase family enzyme
MPVQEDISNEIINASAYLNGYSPFVPWAEAIGCRPHLIKYTERYRSPLLAEEYLLNSYYTRNDMEAEISVEQFYDDASVMTQSLNNKRDYTGLQKIPLPMGVSLDLSLGEAILRRRSSHQFTGDAIGMAYLATIARSARGISSTALACLREGGEVKLHFSTVSSAGHLYPVDLYFIALNVKGLAKGIYLYLEQEDVLLKTGGDDQVKQILAAFATSSNPILFNRANYIGLLAAHPWKTLAKYGNRGLRFILQEIGAITQNIHLANVGLGLGSLDWGSYYEGEVNHVMEFDGINQSALHMVLAGISS